MACLAIPEAQSDVGLGLLSELTVFDKYAKYMEGQRRRESWDEIVDRNLEMHLRKYPGLRDDICSLYENFVRPKLALPSMRSLQFAGKPIEISNDRLFNCAALPIDDVRAFREVMFLLMGGTGVGFSVQHAHINKLPRITHPTISRRFLIQDSRLGWADAVDALMNAYLCGAPRPLFDYRDIRDRGALLRTTGGRAPGPDGLREALEQMERRLSSYPHGYRMSSLEIHDIICFLADAVLSGGIRRSAMISLFDFDDHEMIGAKAGEWWVDNPQRALANNSAMALRHKITRGHFDQYMMGVEKSGSGEPALYFASDRNCLTNPCAEASVDRNFCNLSTINMSAVESQNDLKEFAGAAAFLGTLQAGYTDYHYLRPVWKERTEKESLLGVSMTGLARSDLDRFDFRKAVAEVARVNDHYAGPVEVRPAYRLTVNKPEGTSSAVLQTSSGLHAWHDWYFLRRTRYTRDSALVQYLSQVAPGLVELDRRNPKLSVVSLPCRAPDNAITRDEPMTDMLERIRKMSTEWVRPGHRKGHNGHSVSATVSVKADEWGTLKDWMWEHRHEYNGISVLPYDGGTYEQAPFESITKEQYETLSRDLPKTFNLTNVHEESDGTLRQQEVACAGGACEI